MTRKLTKAEKQKRQIYCIKHGHATFIEVDFCGGVNCGRCEAYLGDRFGKFYNISGYAVVGHICKECEPIITKLNKNDRRIWNELHERRKKKLPNVSN